MSPNLDPTPVDRLIAAIADAQHGVITREQLRNLGVDDNAIRYRVATGRLHRVAPNVFAVGRPSLDMHGQRLRALMTFSSEAWLSHRSGAAVWNLYWDATKSTHVSVMHRRGLAPREGVTLHRPRTLRPEDVTTHDGFAVTTPARTIFDLAATEPDRVVERAIEQSDILHLFDLRKIDALAARRIPGTKAVLTLLETVDAEQQTATRSLLEEDFLALSRQYELERPRVNEFVHGWRVDFHWPSRRLVVELDSAGFHLNRVAFERDRRQDTELQLAGWVVLRFTYRRVMRERRAVVAAVERMLRPANIQAA